MYQPTIGLEIHVELNTKSKMFCSCPNDPDEKHPNVHICPICMGHPGTLPVINKEAVKKTIKTGLALNCKIPEYSKFDRKNYFYPDLPKGYQISQYDAPLCKEGKLQLTINNQQSTIRIRRVHLEEDTARLIHPQEADYSLVDFNRAGIPLMELVTEPDLRGAKEARKFVEELQLILRYLNVSDADMEKGQMRAEVNISLLSTADSPRLETDLRRYTEKELGTKVEVKNLNSFRAVERAIEYEIKRQTKVLNSGKKIVQETRGWLDEAIASSRRVAGARVDEGKGKTVSQREKEEAHDYRYFPEPDLPPLHNTSEIIAEIRADLPELPQQKRERFKREYTLDEKSIEIFVQNKNLGEYFEKVISELPPHLSPQDLSKLTKLASNYLITDLQGLLKGVSAHPPKFLKKTWEGKDFLITPENFAEFITLIFEGKISSKIAKQVLIGMFRTGADPSNIIEERGLVLITDEKEIEKIIKGTIAENKKAVVDFQSGKENAFQYLIGQIMKKSGGKANPEKTKELLTKLLK